MVEFRRDPATGHVYAYRDGRLVGPVLAMGEVAPPMPSGALGGPRRASGDEARPSARRRRERASEGRPVASGTYQGGPTWTRTA